MSEPPRTTPYLLSELLRTDFEPSQYKLHCARRNRDGEDPLNVFAVQGWDAWMGWNSWRETRNDFSRSGIFSMMQVEPASDEWIFGGAFRVVHDRKMDRSVSYDIELIRDATEPLIGRMHLRFRAPVRGRSFYMETALPRISIIEIAPVRWAGAPFPGVANINHSFRDLEVVVRNHRAEWRYALDNFKGIYVWNDRATGKSYVGSATAENGGLWARLIRLHQHGRTREQR